MNVRIKKLVEAAENGLTYAQAYKEGAEVDGFVPVVTGNAAGRDFYNMVDRATGIKASNVGHGENCIIGDLSDQRRAMTEPSDDQLRQMSRTARKRMLRIFTAKDDQLRSDVRHVLEQRMIALGLPNPYTPGSGGHHFYDRNMKLTKLTESQEFKAITVGRDHRETWRSSDMEAIEKFVGKDYHSFEEGIDDGYNIFAFSKGTPDEVMNWVSENRYSAAGVLYDGISFSSLDDFIAKFNEIGIREGLIEEDDLKTAESSDF